jgi:predicted transcriptional regulator
MSGARERVKRSRVELLHDMLLAVQEKGGAIKPTHLLYKANLSHEALKLYVAELIATGMLEERAVKGKRVYALTEKGFTFLAEYKKFRSLADAFGI